MEIYFTKTFPSEMKEKLANMICSNYTDRTIRPNYSHELGIELPLTYEWTLVCDNNPYIKYHNARQLRFIHRDEQIIGMRVKDGIPYFTNDELNTITMIANNITL
jgi:hypothetical protein